MSMDLVQCLRDYATGAFPTHDLATKSAYWRAADEITRLRVIENAALRVAISARPMENGKVYVDKSAMDRLDAALEGRDVVVPRGVAGHAPR